MTPTEAPSPEQLARYREVQRLAYRCAEEVAATLGPGVTEREAVHRMRAWLEARGAEDWFHLPFAWFGDRTAFEGFRHPFEFFPTNRRLERGMAFILDCAPVVGGVTVDIGYASSLGPNALVDRILDDLAAHRALVLELARQRRPLAEIYRAVDRLATRQGLRNRHRQYPGRVIAHRIAPMASGPSRGTLFRFGARALGGLGLEVVSGLRAGWSPLWSDSRLSEHPPVPGLWAVEPHFGFGGVGAKFEEILVVPADGGEVHWLDDELPHVRRWSERGVAA